jgi:hypothetical protein
MTGATAAFFSRMLILSTDISIANEAAATNCKPGKELRMQTNQKPLNKLLVRTLLEVMAAFGNSIAAGAMLTYAQKRQSEEI